jgi:hypothetical protein
MAGIAAAAGKRENGSCGTDLMCFQPISAMPCRSPELAESVLKEDASVRAKTLKPQQALAFALIESCLRANRDELLSLEFAEKLALSGLR